MKIIVPIKQVPETGNVKMDTETGTIIRDGSESIINPLDLYAIETAIELKEKHGGSVTAISMGPPAAEKALREAVAMGCDEAVLITDRKFAGSDTWATSYTLSAAIKKIGPFDFIVAGERATDGDTGQVGPNLAAALNLPMATFIRTIDVVKEASAIQVERLVEEGYEQLELPLPALVTVVKEIAYPRLPTLRGKQRAKKMELLRWGADDLDLDVTKIGLKGSPTRVVKIVSPRVTREGSRVEVKNEETLEKAVEELLTFLNERGFLAEHKRLTEGEKGA
ncbi:MAG TPA: electron transfer flavoprotein subunit beta/FixA family protein [Sediminispirochaeta sp.]|nr:electron transfer flavoprotein subunit beta/FixA family protein [Sediminispirochaeta sp.]